MAGISQVDLDQQFLRLRRLSLVTGDLSAERWQMVAGRDEQPRTPWRVIDQGGRELLVLGYTRRDALSALTAMCSILAVLHGA